jgi:hypothetical protein
MSPVRSAATSTATSSGMSRSKPRPRRIPSPQGVQRHRLRLIPPRRRLNQGALRTSVRRPPVVVSGRMPVVASYSVNQAAVARARRLIDARQYVLDSDWGDVQPRADDENAFLASHSWEEYAEWHLGLTDGASDETKARYGFVYGDFRRVHRTGLIACHYRAAEWRHKDVELAAHELLQLLDKKSA